MRYLLILVLIFFLGCQSKENPEKIIPKIQLSVFTTHSNIWNRTWKDSFDEFQVKNNCEIKFTTFKNSHYLFQELKTSSDVDVVIGLDNVIYSIEDPDSLFIAYRSPLSDRILKQLIFDEEFRLTPIAYGDLAFIINSDEIRDLPYTFGIMQDGKFKKRILFPDPRTSSLGKAFLLWSVSAFGVHGYGHFWRSISENIHTVTDNWGEAYNMFLAEEAPIVLAYSTIPYYHHVKDSDHTFVPVIPSEGGFRLIEAAGVFYKTEHPELSRDLIDFLLSDLFQNSIIENRWIRPAIKAVLPPQLENYPKINNDLTNILSEASIRVKYSKWLKRWLSLTKI
jgi:thiamine transport system substrate-binding protein